ncbi:MAG: arginase [Acidobacteriota bacterium]|nr:MAG: arginase [Acidobacteriota bacterium]
MRLCHLDKDNLKLNLGAFAFLFLFVGVSAEAQDKSVPLGAEDSSHPRIGIVLQPYTARRGADELSIAPELLYAEVVELLSETGVEQVGKESAELTPDEKKQYGVWHRLSLADGHLGRIVAPMVRDGTFSLGLLGNCNSSLGMLAGLQHSGPTSRALEVGLIWIDAHGDFNTPETSLSGWLGGMPVSVAAGRSLLRLRLKAGLDPAISTRHIVMMGLRDVDPLEQVLIDESHITTVSAEAMLDQGPHMQEALDRLSREVDVIYLHIDLDILDATDIPGSFFEVAGGPKANQLVAPIRSLMRNPKVKAVGIASFPTAEKGRAKSMESALTLIRAVIEGLKERES